MYMYANVNATFVCFGITAVGVSELGLWLVVSLMDDDRVLKCFMIVMGSLWWMFK